ncbi:MAG: pyridoxal 5'-phosphate synthase glutaminase subunit PdxT [Acholeplasmataceae bacterium]|nr:pyridoxal 5'-phosphate synthase glutaminase subunit PdxT [Acholeplasmataceae bacterium]
MLTIGILAIQGAFIEHEKRLKGLKINTFEIRQLSDLTKDMDGLILPGGESTAMKRLLIDLNMFESLKKRINDGLPTFGICAGLILLAEDIVNEIPHLGLLHISVMRNYYGRQKDSFKTIGKSKNQEIPMTFIRAPKIMSIKKDVIPIAWYNHDIVGVLEGHLLGTTFHPELDRSNVIYEIFIDLIKTNKKTG